MSTFPKKTPKRVVINESLNTYYEMADEESGISEVASAVKDLFAFEKSSAENMESQLEKLQKLKNERKFKEQQVQLMLRKTSLQKKNLELGEVYLSELTGTVKTIREKFQSVSTNLQQRKEILSTIDDIGKLITKQTYSNNVSLKQIASKNATVSKNQEIHTPKLQEEIHRLNINAKSNIDDLGKQCGVLLEELTAKKSEIDEVVRETEEVEKENEKLELKLDEMEKIAGEMSLNLREISAKKRESVSDLEALEEEHQKIITGFCEKQQSLTSKLSEKNKKCATFEKDVEFEKTLSKKINDDRKIIDDKLAPTLESIKQCKAQYVAADEDSTLTTAEIEQSELKQKLLNICHQLEEEEMRKEFDLNESTTLEQQYQRLKSECDELLQSTQDANDREFRINTSIEEKSREILTLQESNDKLGIQIQQLNQAISEYKTQDDNEQNAFVDLQLDLQKSTGEIKQSLDRLSDEHTASCDELKKQHSDELNELLKANEGDISNLSKSVDEIKLLEKENAESVKLLENNYDGVKSECDVISRKNLILERSLVEENRKKRVAPPPILPPPRPCRSNIVARKRSFEMMSDSSDDAPSALDILRRKRELQIKKMNAKKSNEK